MLQKGSLPVHFMCAGAMSCCAAAVAETSQRTTSIETRDIRGPRETNVVNPA